MKEVYETPVVEIIEFETEDVLTDSPGNDMGLQPDILNW